ncbi:glycosyltransferase family 1 protein [Archangium minus]|uniref:Glycosyltransferase family 1 protein n=2 Tax=Archangium minus TaxID=83450 RepID=A0ABY9WJ17_9BACT|nr:glycosyltransferase family 1 protein [Archangium minus]
MPGSSAFTRALASPSWWRAEEWAVASPCPSPRGSPRPCDVSFSPMRALLIGSGSRGDFQPMLALAVAMRRAGHTVTLLGSPVFQAEAEAFGISFGPCGHDVREILAKTREQTRTPLGFVRTLNSMLESEFELQLTHIEPRVQGVDLVVGGGAVMAAHLLADAARVPYRYIGYTPQILPSSYHPMMMVPITRSPRWLNRLLWRVSGGFYNRQMDKRYNAHRTRRGLPRDEDIFSSIFPREKTLLACDPELLPAPPDLADIPQVGSFALPDDRPLPPDLEAFLSAGPPPIYVGFGSMPDDDPQRTTQRVREAAQKAGVRLLLSSGWSGLGGGEDLGPSAHGVGPVSHGLLFPRLAGSVHHGGAGTTAASARAGIPQLLVPHAFDQFMFARQVHKLGLGPQPIPKGALTVDRLAEGLRELANNGPMREKARATGESIRSRDPLRAAVSWLEGALTRHKGATARSA